ncbi:cyclic nucleotide-gated cation channel alpha-3-like isoform X3 [Bolinopsis microptera]|uniref:cyclic nucleotide-gated cation channel alpha-3-like isoform X3 n=1 Tax=Bolinopsis microptera TaxID=2820187 RepID=UPI0030799D09
MVQEKSNTILVSPLVISPLGRKDAKEPDLATIDEEKEMPPSFNTPERGDNPTEETSQGTQAPPPKKMRDLWIKAAIKANKTALDQKLKVHPTSEEGSNGNHLGPDGKNNVQSMASVAQTITFIRRISKRTGKKEPDEFLQRLNFGAAADIKENKPLSTKDKGWNCLINFFCHFVFDPFSDIYYYWLSIISLAVLYNFIIIPARISFSELEEGNFFTTWMVIDILADVLYVLDFFASFRIGFLERGLLVTDTAQLSKKYVKSMAFYIDIFSIIPTQIVYAFRLSTASIYIAPLIRLSKFFKFHRLVAWNDRTECRTSVPTLWRIVTLFTIMLMVMHWNACLYFFVSTTVIRQNPNTHPNRSKFIYPYDTEKNGTKNKYASTAMKYAVSLYWSTQTMTTIGEMEQPEELWEYVYLTIIFLIGVMIFASVVGSIGNIITNLRANRSVFQDRLDHLKEYMGYRNVGKDLQNRIIRWFDYLWAQNHTFEEEDVLKYLPDKLQAEMAIHVHLATLKQVELFQNCESGFLIALVLKLKHQVYSPGDYVCRKGDIGREMFIVKQGMLQVTADDGRALATLSDGSYFGEISLLNVGKNGNRRTANVRSVGYSDLFCLRKEDLLHALNDYPEMREVLKEAARKKLNLNNQSPRPETPEAARQKLARDAKPQQDEDTTETERRISFTNSVELADTLGKRLEDLEKLVLTLAKEIKTTNKSVLTLQKQLTKVYPNSKSDSSSSSSSDDES